MTGDIELQATQLVLDGAGQVVVEGDISGGGGPVTNSLRHFGYHVASTIRRFAAELPQQRRRAGQGPYGTATLTNGPGDRGLDFDSDGDFSATGAVAQGDNYVNVSWPR